MNKKFSVFVVLLMVFSLFSQVGLPTTFHVSASEGDELNVLFDFGSQSTPVQDGYNQVANTLIYNEELGYGFDKEVGFRDRANESNKLLRDFALAENAEFKVDLPNGDYLIRIIAGDAIAFNRTSFIIEDEDYGDITSDSGQYATLTEHITITDGQLNIKIGENGRINGLEIIPMSEITSLKIIETSLSPERFVQLGWDAESAATSYNIYRKKTTEDTFVQIGETTDIMFTDTTVELGTSYIYAITLVNELGIESSTSNEVQADLTNEEITAPGTPSGLKVDNITEDSVTLKWDKVEGAIEYQIYRAKYNQNKYPDHDVEYVRLGSTEEPQFIDDTIFTYRNYYYIVVAVNEGGVSERSESIESPISKRKLRQMEKLNRALVAIDTEDGIYIGWKMLGTDPDDVTFDLYRNGEKINEQPITTSTNYLDPDGTIESKYQVRVNNGSGNPVTEEVNVWSEQYVSIPLDQPEGGVTPDGVEYTYSANDASVGDVTGDGNYEMILKWDPSNSKDNSQSGYTGNVYFDAYTLDGERLWRIDAGKNIRAGAHYSQFLVYDFDGDGKAEIVMKTADGTIDGTGQVIGDPDADYRNSNGYILDGPEYLTVFNGETGEAMQTIDYYPPRGKVSDWGDNYGNRVDRFLAGVAYLDGERPSFVMARGYYTRTVLAAYNWRDGKLTQEWVFDSNDEGNNAYAGQGNHSLAIADVDGDGKDEIIYGASVINHDGTGLHSTGWGHGDANHVSDLDPNRPGLEIFETYEDKSSPVGYAIRDAETGELIWGEKTGTDVGRGMAADIDPRYDGAELWASGSKLHATTGEVITEKRPRSINYGIWWDGDLLRELLDHDLDSNKDEHGVGRIEKWNWEMEKTETIFVPEETRSNNWTKGNPTLQADLFGDWREEVIWPSADSTELRIYTTTDITEHRIYTLMHDPTYRLSVAWQNVAYNQPPHPGFFLGHNMDPAPTPAIYTVGDEDKKFDTHALAKLIETYEKISNEDKIYTEQSFATFQSAIEQAIKILPTIENKEDLQTAMDALQTGYDQLEKVEAPEMDDTANEEKESKVEVSAEKNDDGNQKNNDEYKNGSENGRGQNDNRPGETLPNTATTMYTTLIIGVVILLIGAVSYFIISRKKKKLTK